MMRELNTVIERNGMNGPPLERETYNLCNDARFQGLHLSHYVDARGAIDEGQYGVPRVVLTSMYQITLPIAGTSPFFNVFGPFSNVPFLRLPRILALATCEPMAALEVQKKLSLLPATMDPGIYRFETHWEREPEQLFASDDLFGRVILLEKSY